jgi:hypothetical protein
MKVAERNILSKISCFAACPESMIATMSAPLPP